MEEKKEEINAEVDEKEIAKSNNSEKKSESNEKKFSVNDRKNEFVERARENPWMVASVVLGVLLLGFLFSGSGVTGGVITGSAINEGEIVSADVAGEKFESFASSKGVNVEILSVKESNGLYEISFSSADGDSVIYLTLDGENLINGLIPVVESRESRPEVRGYSETDLEKLREFSSCLAENGIKIYGADWCGWTKKLAVETLGGFDIAGDAYIECTKEIELCASEGVKGYPTIKINGELFSGERTLEGFGKVTGCFVPELEGNSGTGSVSESDGSC